MKTFLALVLVIVVGFGIYYVVHTHSTTVVAPVKIIPATPHPDPSNATFQFEDGPVTLNNGSETSSIGANDELQTETDLTDFVAYGDINNDSKTDTAVLLEQTSSGTGVFYNVAAYVSGVVSYNGSNAIFLGDRIIPKTITIKNGIITVTYLDRTSSEAMTDDPTLLVTKTFVYTDGELVEK